MHRPLTPTLSPQAGRGRRGGSAWGFSSLLPADSSLSRQRRGCAHPLSPRRSSRRGERVRVRGRARESQRGTIRGCWREDRSSCLRGTPAPHPNPLPVVKNDGERGMPPSEGQGSRSVHRPLTPALSPQAGRGRRGGSARGFSSPLPADSSLSRQGRGCAHALSPRRSLRRGERGMPPSEGQGSRSVHRPLTPALSPQAGRGRRERARRTAAAWR